MALRNQPYFPLYVQDYLTDEKLNECSAEAQGVYIKILCVMHKSKEYGTILLRQKDCQISDFAKKLSKHLTFTLEVLEKSLSELIEEDVLQIDYKNGILSQKRMIKDNDISIKRSKAGSKGGFAKAKGIAKNVANSEYENEDENEIEIENEDNNKELDYLKPYEKPTLERVKQFFKSAGYDIKQAEGFWSYYDAQGWETASGKKIKYWSSKVLGWMNSSKNYEKPEIKSGTPNRLEETQKLIAGMGKKQVWKDSPFKEFNNELKKEG